MFEIKNKQKHSEPQTEVPRTTRKSINFMTTDNYKNTSGSYCLKHSPS